MSTPTLVIGLGGTGLKAATHIKKNILEANQNRLPNEMAIMVLDTEREIKYRAGGWGQERGGQHATGPVGIDVGEYIAMTGNVRALGETIKNEQYEMLRNPAAQRNQLYRHMSGWFQATYYLDTAGLPDQVWNLDEGAGRYRQFGRMAFFHSIDIIEQKLKASIQAVQRASQGNTLYVHVVGSLAGGTGAALFADVAHLVQLIAKDAGYNQAPVILGHFVLTEAFRGTRQVKLNESGVLENFNARMYAALRELTRLQSPIIRRSGGYPLHYDPRGTGTRKSSLGGKPYDAIYLYDGIAERIQLNQRPIETGLAPAIADVVTAYIDEKSGGAFRSHSVNYSAFYSAFHVPVGAVTYGSVGVYTIELPIYHITEGWTHRLALDVLDTLLAPDPASIDRSTQVPGRLRADQRGGQPANPAADAQNWLRHNTTSLVSKIGEWGQRAEQTSMIRDEVVREILALNAEGWQQHLAPTDPAFANYVAEAQMVLRGSLVDKTSTNYYVDLEQGGSAAQEKALNLQREVDERLRQMVGETEEVWKRKGGEFRRALVRLGNHHVNEFDSGLVKTVRDYLNGSDELSDPVLQKGGKLGYVLGYLSHLESLLSSGAQTLSQADRMSQGQRRPLFDAADGARRTAFAKLQRGGGVLNSNAKTFRDKSNELAQFHKADIARQVVYDLAVRLHKSVQQLLNEARLWETALATAIADNGGAYAQVVQGKREVDSDRLQSQNAVRWVIADDEPGDTYISNKYAKYTGGKAADLLRQVQWRVVKTDGDLRIEFTLNGQAWKREAGQRLAANAGKYNVAQLLNLCRAPFEQAWRDMSLTDYLYQNFYGGGRNTLEQLAERIYKNSGYLLDLVALKKTPGMRTAFVRVYQENIDTPVEQFLREMRMAVDVRFQVTTTTDQRQGAQQTIVTENGVERKVEGYISELGQPSTDPFKISFLIYGDLLQPDDIKAFDDGRRAYRVFSGADEQWRELQILPAETNALQIERGLERADQRRREFDPDVVTVMEDMGNFQTAMRCLAYGEQDYHWNINNQTGLLLHEYTPLENNAAGHSYWRLVLMPKGTRGADGNTYDASGGLATPLEYQLSAMSLEPSLLEAFIQLISKQADIRSGAPIDWTRVEATVTQAMAWHRDHWSSPQALGWRLQPSKDARLQTELTDKAAQLVRLNALKAAVDEQMALHPWAWHKSGGAVPPDVATSRATQVRLQIKMDLLAAIRGAAETEILALNRRLRQVGVQHGQVPQERLIISTPFRPAADDAPPPPPPAPSDPPSPSPEPVTRSPIAPPEPVTTTTTTVASDGADDGWWQCSNGHWNEPDARFCGICGQPHGAVAGATETATERPATPAVAVAEADAPEAIALEATAPEAGVSKAIEPETAPEMAALSPVSTDEVTDEGLRAALAWAETLGEEPLADTTDAAQTATPPAALAAPAEFSAEPIRCLNGHAMQPGWIFCPECGQPPAPRQRLCLNGHEMQPQWTFCPRCGAGPRP